MKLAHYVMLACGALAAGCPALEAAFPPGATPYLKAAQACLIVVGSVLGAISPSATSPEAP
jgi:hypothetical protein